MSIGMNGKEELARKEFEHNGKWWMVTVFNYWLIEGKPVELVWSLWKPTAYGGWKRANADRAPKAVVRMASSFYDGFVSGFKKEEVAA